MRRPVKEYFLENEADKIFVDLENRVKLRVLYLSAKNSSDLSMNIIYYTGYNSYLFAWFESVEVLRQNHNIYFIETREKEFSFLPENDKRYDIYSLAEDFNLVLKELDVPLETCVFTGSSIASNAVLYAMSSYSIKPFVAVLATPQTEMRANTLASKWARAFPRWLAISLKPLVRLISRFIFRRDKKHYQSFSHSISRMFSKYHFEWLKAAPIMDDYYMENDNFDNISSSLVIVCPEDDPTHDMLLVQKIKVLLPKAEIQTVPKNSDTHNETLAEIIENTLTKLKENNL
ncbi:MAG: hypothetical protein ACTSQC_07220 [Candidatus Heimdallarchaeaceae archaeon]